MLFEEPDLPVLHNRDYEVKAYRLDDARMLIRGAVQDRIPASFFIADDTEPLVMHHMVVDLTVSAADLEILAADVLFETHPHNACPTITEHYGKLVGLSIARGYTHKVRELFGGPRGCTHTTALLVAMAPVAMQAFIGGRVMRSQGPLVDNAKRLLTPEGRAARANSNRNTCHVWIEGGEHLDHILHSEEVNLPLPIVKRLQAGG